MRWYGWQILTPTLASDTIALAGFFSGPVVTSSPGPQPAAGWAIFAVGLIGRGISGPIVHLAHHRPAKALASLALEAALPAAALGAVFASAAAGNGGGGGDDDFPNLAPFFLGISLVPLAFSAGTAIDSAALAWEDRPPPSQSAQAVTWSVAPLTLPALHAGAAHPGPVPMGAGLVGTF